MKCKLHTANENYLVSDQTSSVFVAEFFKTDEDYDYMEGNYNCRTL